MEFLGGTPTFARSKDVAARLLEARVSCLNASASSITVRKATMHENPKACSYDAKELIGCLRRLICVFPLLQRDEVPMPWPPSGTS